MELEDQTPIPGPRPQHDVPLISLVKVHVERGGRRLLDGISWFLRPGRNWLLTGGNGSGKTTFLRLLRGEIWPSASSPGNRLYAFAGRMTDSPVEAHRRLPLVSPESSERYIRNEWDLTGFDVVRSGIDDAVWPRANPSREDQQHVLSVMKQLRIEHLAAKSILHMSLGESRAVLIARAIASGPACLLLDEICEGLDTTSQARILDILSHLTKQGVQVVYATHRRDEIFPGLTHHLHLHMGRIDFIRSPVAQPPESDAAVPRVSPAPETRTPLPPSGEVLLRLENCDVYRSRDRVLQRINWTIREGENWILAGPNGAGKSTLIRLLYGDEYPALGGRVFRFGLPEAVALSEYRPRIGLVATHLQDHYDHNTTAHQVVVSGFHSSIGLWSEPTEPECIRAADILARLGSQDLANRPFQELSYGERRRILLARALVTRPRLLLFDEPFAGLDPAAREQFRILVSRLIDEGTQVVCAAHHTDDLPKGMTHLLRLEGGRISLAAPLDHTDALPPNLNPRPISDTSEESAAR